jgi:hypothetical protein
LNHSILQRQDETVFVVIVIIIIVAAASVGIPFVVPW